jgi:hypothetical protein
MSRDPDLAWSFIQFAFACILFAVAAGIVTAARIFYNYSAEEWAATRASTKREKWLAKETRQRVKAKRAK